MPTRMVNGCTIKIKKYCKCGNELKGLRSRYCSDLCYSNLRKERQKKKYKRNHKPLPNRICIWCKNKFTPRTSNQKCCSTHCRREHTNFQWSKKKKHIKKKNYRVLLGQFGGTRSPTSIIEKTSEIKSIKKSLHAEEIKEYLKSGGKVTKLTPQADGRVPGVNMPLNLRNIQNHNSWAIDTAMGHGYELDLMDEIYTTQEVLDEP